MKTRQAPWLAGIIEALKCVALVRGSSLATRNRIALVLLDSTLEISLRQYLQNVKRLTLDPKEHKPRYKLFGVAKANIQVPSEVWDHLDYYWNTRNPQYHQDANLTVTDAVYSDFEDLVCYMLDKMFDMGARVHLETPAAELVPGPVPGPARLDPARVRSKVDAVIAAVGTGDVMGAPEVKERLKQIGLPIKVSDKEVRAYLSQRYFYKDETGRRKLSSAGRKKFEELCPATKR